MGMSVGGGSEDAPMGDMNTTPLIDVMLVLLIMFIIAIPIQTHAVKIDMPRPDQPPVETEVDPVVHRIEIDFLNNVYWDGTEVDLQTLRGYLKRAGEMPEADQPQFHLRPDALSRFETVNAVMAMAQRNGVIKVGFVGNEAYIN